MSDNKQSFERGLKENPFPVTASTSPKEKSSDKIGLRAAKHIYYAGQLNNISNGKKARIHKNRLLASNSQDENKYKKSISAAIDNKGDTSFLNIDWKPQTPGAKFVNTIVGDMLNQDHEIQFNSLDPQAKTTKEKTRDEYYGKLARRDVALMLENESGIPLEDRSGFQPTSSDEIEVYMEMTYKQPIEIGMEEIVKLEINNNHYHTRVKPRLLHDLVENNVGRVRLFFDKNNKIQLRYVDIAEYISSYTDEPDYSDVEYEGEVVYMTISQLRRLDTNNSMSDKDWWKIAKDSQKKYGNPEWVYGEDYRSDYRDNKGYSYSYDDYRIPTLDFIFYTQDKQKYVITKKDNGRTHVDKKDMDYEVSKRSKHEKNVEITEKEMSYEGFWIIGTDKILGYGKSKNILRYRDFSKKDSVSLMPNLIRRYISFEPNMRYGKSKSIVEIMEPNLDVIQTLVLSKRKLISEYQPLIISMDLSGVLNTMELMNVKSPMDLVQIYMDKGFLFHTRVDANGDPANGAPVDAKILPFADELLKLDQAIMAEINHIRENTGINDVRDGASPDKDALVGIEKMRLLASNNVTREIYQAYLDGILAPIGKVISRMAQYKIQYGDGKAEYQDVISVQGVESLEFMKDVTLAQLGVIVEALPTEIELQEYLNALRLAQEKDEIRLEDYFNLKRVDNIKKGERYLVHRKNKYAEEKMLEFQQREQITAQREAASAQAAAQAKVEAERGKVEAEILKMREEFRLKKEFDDHQTMNKIKLENVKSSWDLRIIDEAQDGDSDGGTKQTAGMTPKVMSHPDKSAKEAGSINK